MTNALQFRNYQAKDAKIFKSLNIEWLETYFEVEPYDELVLSNPQKEILDPGGQIFMLLKDNHIIGTFAFINKGNGVYEFSKMAVKPEERGKGYGNLMMQYMVQYAAQQPWKKLILYSNTLLMNSIHLYRKYGFHEVPIDPGILYARGNIKMEYLLNS